MALEFIRLADVEALSEVPENATVLAEVNGAIKRVPGNGLGGSGNSIILTQVGGSSGGGAAPMSMQSFDTFTANMDFADAMAAFRAGEISGAMVYLTDFNGGGEAVSAMSTRMQTYGAAPVNNGYSMTDLAIIQDASFYFGIDCLVFLTMYTQGTIFWTVDGISTEEPSGGGSDK